MVDIEYGKYYWLQYGGSNTWVIGSKYDMDRVTLSTDLLTNTKFLRDFTRAVEIPGPEMLGGMWFDKGQVGVPGQPSPNPPMTKTKWQLARDKSRNEKLRFKMAHGLFIKHLLAGRTAIGATQTAIAQTDEFLRQFNKEVDNLG